MTTNRMSYPPYTQWFYFQRCEWLRISSFNRALAAPVLNVRWWCEDIRQAEQRQALHLSYREVFPSCHSSWRAIYLRQSSFLLLIRLRYWSSSQQLDRIADDFVLQHVDNYSIHSSVGKHINLMKHWPNKASEFALLRPGQDRSIFFAGAKDCSSRFSQAKGDSLRWCW